ncbi:hypothetical protein H5410_041916, partial [Solanum commersonii]
HLNTFVELELAFEASIVSLRIFDNELVSSNASFISIIDVLNPAECSSVLSLKGEGQVCDEKEQLTHHRVVSRSNTLPPNASKRENDEGKSRKAMNQTKWWIAEVFGDIVLELEDLKIFNSKKLEVGLEESLSLT